MKRRTVFPFAAVIGQDTIKKALILNVINPAIGGVLISGEKGTAKSTLVRGLAAAMTDIEVVDLSLNITEDRLVGSIDIERAIKEGRKCFDSGLLHRAHGNILYVDEVNLLSDSIVNCLLSVSAFRENRVEREGISYVHPSEFVLVGTMNPEEGQLRPQFLDRFGLYVETCGLKDEKERMEIIRRRLDFEGQEAFYMDTWQAESHRLAQQIQSAQALLPHVEISPQGMESIAEVVQHHNCAGNRAEIVLAETVRALAAYAQRTYGTPEDLMEAAALVLPHRVREMPRQETQPQDTPDTDQSKESQNNEPPEQQTPQATPDTPEAHDENKERSPSGEDGSEDTGREDDNPEDNPDRDPENEQEGSSTGSEETVDEPEGFYSVKALDIQVQDRKKREGSGKRSRTVANSARGRYIRYTFPRGKVRDIAFDATLRAAAPFQNSRTGSGNALTVMKSDFRQKVREMRTGSTILFVVDASGSMGANQRMKAVKGAILSLLNDAYQKRDKVGMIAFRKDSAELLLGITRSVDLAQRCLMNLPTGGKTPLASGLLRGYKILKAAKAKDPNTVPYLVLVSDGRANVSLNGGNPVKEAMEIAEHIATEGIRTLVIDTEKDFIKLELAEKLATVLKADYCKLEDMREGEIETIVRMMA